MNRAALLTAALAVTLTNPTAGAAAQAAGSFDWATYSGPEGTRRYKLFVPASRDASKPAPLAVMLHGCTQDPDDFARGSRFNEAAAEHGVIVAWPEQPSASQPMKCWSWYDPAHQVRGAGEPAIIAAITREVIAKHRVDPARVYIGGVSAGGAMAVNTAASYPELFAAVGTHSAIAYRVAGSVAEALPIMKQGLPMAPMDSLVSMLQAAGGAGRPLPPLIVFHGLADAVVAPDNGMLLASQWWEAMGAGPNRIDPGWLETSDVNGYRTHRTEFDDKVEQWRVEGLGHAWSGGSPDGTFTDPRGPDATREFLRFFLARRKS